MARLDPGIAFKKELIGDNNIKKLQIPHLPSYPT
jgi:hypothetical protein